MSFPKIWQSYLVKHLHSNLQNSLEVENVISFHKRNHNGAKAFLEYAKLEQNLLLYAIIAKQPTGVFSFRMEDVVDKFFPDSHIIPMGPLFECKPMCSRYYIIFTFHKFFALNLTLNELYFSTGLQICDNGGLRIAKHDNYQTDHDELLKHKIFNQYNPSRFKPMNSCWRRKEHKYAFHFCGYYSEFVIYPEGTLLSLALLAHTETYFIVNLFYSMINTDVVLTKQIYLFYFSYPVFQYVYSVGIIERRIYILAQKTKFIRIPVLPQNNYIYEVYDGPGELSKRIVLSENSFTTTTFQCLVNVFTHVGENLPINFSSHAGIIHQKIWVTHDSSYRISDSSLCQKLCLVDIQTTDGFEINITVGMFFTGKSLFLLDINLLSSSCLYGGLAAFDHGKTEQIALCENYTARNIYSSKSRLIIVLYQYPTYSKISVQLHVSKNPCNTIHLDICFAQAICPYNAEKCNQYLQNLTRNTRVKLEYGLSFENILTPTVFQLQANDCFTLQFHNREISFKETESSRRNILSRRSICIFWFYSKEHLSLSHDFYYLLKGAIKPFPKQSINLKVGSNLQAIAKLLEGICPFVWYETFAINNLKVLSDMSNFFKFEIFPRYPIKNALLVKQNLVSTNKGFLWAKSSTHDERSHLFVGMFVNSFTWLDVSIWKNVVTNSYSKTNRLAAWVINLTSHAHQESQHIDRQDALQISPADNVQSIQEKFSLDIICSEIKIKEMLPSSWTTRINEKIFLSIFYISLPFVIAEISFFPRSLISELSIMLTVMPDHHIQFLHQGTKECDFQNLTDATTFQLPLSLHWWDYDCKCFTLPSSQFPGQKYVVFTDSKVSEMFEFCPVKRKWSWQESKKICESLVNGSLPILSTRDEMKEILSIIKMSPFVYAFNAIFIALEINTHQVSFLCALSA